MWIVFGRFSSLVVKRRCLQNTWPSLLTAFNMDIRPFMRRGISEITRKDRKDRRFWDGLSVAEKRKHYDCGNKYVTLDKVDTWQEYRETRPPSVGAAGHGVGVNEVLNSKVSLWRGDITTLEIDAIVNAANSSLLGGGGVDGAIHRSAGQSLYEECLTLDGCDTGNAKITSGHRLPARHILHTVGPMGQNAHKLASCYRRCLGLVSEHKLRSVAFPCISTGIYGYPNERAAHIALRVVREWLSNCESIDSIDRVIFCVFLPTDLEIYRRLLRTYFPSPLDVVAPKETAGTDEEDEEDVDGGGGCDLTNDANSSPPVSHSPAAKRRDSEGAQASTAAAVGTSTVATDSSEAKSTADVTNTEASSVSEKEELKEDLSVPSLGRTISAPAGRTSQI